MTHKDMYDALVYGCRYKTDGYYPSTRYDKCYRNDADYSAWRPMHKDCADIIKEHVRKDSNNTMNFKDTKLLVDGRTFKADHVEVYSDYTGTRIRADAYLDSSSRTTAEINCGGHRTTPSKPLTIENVIFNPPATIVFWSDKTKTIVKADYDYESYDPEKGIAMAIAKKMLGDNKGKYYELFKYWRGRWDEQNARNANITIPELKNPFEAILNNLKGTVNTKLLTIQEDGALTRIEDYARLNDLVSKDLKEDHDESNR